MRVDVSELRALYFHPVQQTVSRWRVLSEGGLRIRAAPSLSATAFGVLPKESIGTQASQPNRVLLSWH
jgi:hypothetical protein